MFSIPRPLFDLVPTGPQPEPTERDKYPNIYNTFLIKENPKIEEWVKAAFPSFKWVTKTNVLHNTLFTDSPRFQLPDTFLGGDHIKQVYAVIKVLEQFLKSIELTNLQSKTIIFDSFTVDYIMSTLVQSHTSQGNPFVTFNLQIGYYGGSRE